jgi:hypothetical protein
MRETTTLWNCRNSKRNATKLGKREGERESHRGQRERELWEERDKPSLRGRERVIKK